MPCESPSDRSTSAISKSPPAIADIPCSKLVTWTSSKGKSLASSSSSCVNRASPGLSSIRRIRSARVEGAPASDMVTWFPTVLRGGFVAGRQRDDRQPEALDFAHDRDELLKADG